MNKKRPPRKLPYGVSDYAIMIKENYYYVDKNGRRA